MTASGDVPPGSESGHRLVGGYEDLRRRVLGLKGTMSEAELHLLRARLRGGILNKARRGELTTPLPVGLVYDEQGRVQLDPDAQVRQSFALFFETFRRTGSGYGAVKAFREQGLRFPRRLRNGPRKGELVWGELTHCRALQALHNPRYAGAFCFGRRRTRKGPDGRKVVTLVPREEWLALIPNAHDGYIPWQAYEDNQRRLRECAQAHGLDRRVSPPREGPALLQGLVLCGVCGRRMTVRYHVRHERQFPDYICARDGIERAERLCQQIPGAAIDEAIGDLLLKTLTPMALDVALEVQQELTAQVEQADRLRAKQVERARYEADLARHRYMSVDPNNRLVADALEADWNAKLRTLQQAQEDYERQRRADRRVLDPDERTRLLNLATDFPRLWQGPGTSHRDRKRMARLLVEDATLIKNDADVTVHVRFKGGTHTTLTVPRARPAWKLRQTPPAIVAEIDHLLDHHTLGEIAQTLNARGLRTGTGRSFLPRHVARIRKAYGLKTRYARLRDAGLLTVAEMARRLHVVPDTIKSWRRHGLQRGRRANDRDEYLFEPPGPDAPVKSQGWKFAERRRFPKVLPDRTQEAQYEA